MAKYLDSSGLTQVWNKAKETFLTPGGGIIDIFTPLVQRLQFQRPILI